MSKIEVKLNPDVPPTGNDLAIEPAYHNRIREAVERGYYVTLCGRMFGPKGGLSIKNRGSQKYPTFTTNWGKVMSLPVHKFVGYFWYGEASFSKGTHVRHLDADTENLQKTNIILGSASDNERDKPKEARVRQAKLARAAQGFTPVNAKLSEDDVRYIRKVYTELGGKKAPHGFLQDLIVKFGVSKTVINKVVHRKYYPNVE